MSDSKNPSRFGGGSVNRRSTALMLLALAAVLVAWYLRRERRTFAVPGVGRVLRQDNPVEADAWRRWHDSMAGDI